MFKKIVQIFLIIEIIYVRWNFHFQFLQFLFFDVIFLKFWFFCKYYLFKILYLRNFVEFYTGLFLQYRILQSEFYTGLSIFSYFLINFPYLTKISILDQNFHILPKFPYLFFQIILTEYCIRHFPLKSTKSHLKYFL